MNADVALEELATEELRHRAFALARQRRDLRFFVDIIKHLPAAHRAEELDGWLSAIGPAIDDAVAMWHELSGHDLGDAEPLLRAAFIDYIREHDRPGRR